MLAVRRVSSANVRGAMETNTSLGRVSLVTKATIPAFVKVVAVSKRPMAARHYSGRTMAQKQRQIRMQLDPKEML